MYSESSLESTVQRCGTCGPSHGHERHRCQPAKGTACRVRTIVDVPALGDLNVLRSSTALLHPFLFSIHHLHQLLTLTYQRWHLCPRVQRHPSHHSQPKPITPRFCLDLSRRRLCLTQPWVARTIRASSLSTSAGVLCVGIRVYHMKGVLALVGVDLAACPRSPTHFTLRSSMILKMCVTHSLLGLEMLYAYTPGFFLMVVLDVRRFCDEGDVAEAMAEGCGVRGALVSLDLGTPTWIAYLMGVTYVGSIHEV